MGWLWLVGSIELQVSFAKEPYKRDFILQKRPIILSILLSVATPYELCITFGSWRQISSTYSFFDESSHGLCRGSLFRRLFREHHRNHSGFPFPFRRQCQHTHTHSDDNFGTHTHTPTTMSGLIFSATGCFIRVHPWTSCRISSFLFRNLISIPTTISSLIFSGMGWAVIIRVYPCSCTEYN